MGEVEWTSGLVKKVLADGCASNTCAFFSLFCLTGDSIYEERTKAFGRYLRNNIRESVIEEEHLDEVDTLYSLFHGLPGVACLWFDLLKPFIQPPKIVNYKGFAGFYFRFMGWLAVGEKPKNGQAGAENRDVLKNIGNIVNASCYAKAQKPDCSTCNKEFWSSTVG